MNMYCNFHQGAAMFPVIDYLSQASSNPHISMKQKGCHFMSGMSVKIEKSQKQCHIFENVLPLNMQNCWYNPFERFKAGCPH